MIKRHIRVIYARLNNLEPKSSNSLDSFNLFKPFYKIAFLEYFLHSDAAKMLDNIFLALGN